MYYSTKNKNRDAARRIRQKCKNGPTSQTKRNMKKGYVKKSRIKSRKDVSRTAEFIHRRNIQTMSPGSESQIPDIEDMFKTPPSPSLGPPPGFETPPLPIPEPRRVSQSFIAWARSLPFQSALKHNWALDIQMNWRKKMLSKRIQIRAIRRDGDSVLQNIRELWEFTRSSYVHLLDCSPLTTTLEFMHDRLCEISELHYAALPTPGSAYNEWYNINGTLAHAHNLLEELTDRVVSVINTRSGSTLMNRTLAKTVKRGKFGLNFSDIKALIPKETSRETSRDYEEEAWKDYVEEAWTNNKW